MVKRLFYLYLNRLWAQAHNPEKKKVKQSKLYFRQTTKKNPAYGFEVRNRRKERKHYLRAKQGRDDRTGRWQTTIR